MSKWKKKYPKHQYACTGYFWRNIKKHCICMQRVEQAAGSCLAVLVCDYSKIHDFAQVSGDKLIRITEES